MTDAPRVVLFDIDGTLIESGGSSDRAWHRAFADLLGLDVDVAAHTGRGVPDPEVGRQVYVAYTEREPEPAELARVMAKRLEYLYITANGGHSHGRVAPEADAISFPVATLVTAGKDFNFRSRWKRLGDDAYEVLREYETDKCWVSVRIEMKKVQ